MPVALLMIGGEFDLSAGAMIGSSGLLLGYLATFQDVNIWPAMAIVLLFGLAIGFINGFVVIRTKLPSFIVTLATFFVLQGVNAALHAEAHRHDRDPGHRRRERVRRAHAGSSPRTSPSTTSR